MRRRLVAALQRLLGPLTDCTPVATNPQPVNPSLTSSIDPPCDPFDIPYQKPRYVRVMPFCPEKTLFVYRAKESVTDSEKKKALKAKKEAGLELDDEISTIFRVQLDGFDYTVPTAAPDETPFAKAAELMSSKATDMLANRLAHADKKDRHARGRDSEADAVTHTPYGTTLRVRCNDFATDASRSLKETLLRERVLNLWTSQEGKDVAMYPYTIRWLQYPLESVTIPFCPREGFPLAAFVQPMNGALFCLFDSHYKEAASFAHGLRYCWFTMDKGTGKERMSMKDACLEWEWHGNRLRPQLKGAQFVCEGSTFTPTEEHVGEYIAVAVSCLPAVRATDDDVTSADSDAQSGPEKHWTVLGLSAEAVVSRSYGEELLAREKMRWAERDEKERKESGDMSRLRLVSYNLLAEQYINLSLPPAKWFYPYLEKKYQQPRYRYLLALKELDGYAADLYFLQEVDKKMAYQYLPALFKQRNYDFAFHRKGMQVREGSGIVWRAARFVRTGADRARWLTDLLVEAEENADIRELLSRATPETAKFFQTRPTIVHITQLSDLLTGDTVIVGNTHLHHDPKHEHYKKMLRCLAVSGVSTADDGRVGQQSLTQAFEEKNQSMRDGDPYCALYHLYIQALQTALVARELARCVREAAAELAEQRGDGDSEEPVRIRVLLGTDLNSTPDAAAVALLSGRTIAKDDAVWAADKEMGGMELRLPAELRGMVNLSGAPAYTNYTLHKGMDDEGGLESTIVDYALHKGMDDEGGLQVRKGSALEQVGYCIQSMIRLQQKGFAGCIDYIWACGVETIAVAPQPSVKEIERHTALPSPRAPSDHLAVVLSAKYST
ncbi:pde-12 [Pristionchus pacificus]|uniref:Pde-12 n=1 Tax=Pristionchus pacificus TaxID=54126 RepID=A0A2A6CHC3_PRIPA|nr:pde-12 [Pristionchus pacificus]|eukprot:PDM77625.1 pde-12 [Pristionchus pacificus]